VSGPTGLVLLPFRAPNGSANNNQYRLGVDWAQGLPAVSENSLFTSELTPTANVELAVHGGNINSNRAVLRWTAGPSVGALIDISGNLRSLAGTGAKGTRSLDVFANGVNVVSLASAVHASPAWTPYSVNNVSIAPGQVVDFVIATSTAGGNTGIEAVIMGTASNPIPEPSTFALAALGLIGLGLFGRRRRRR
jgi:MYXO-CTERM domain-containing protein